MDLVVTIEKIIQQAKCINVISQYYNRFLLYCTHFIKIHCAAVLNDGNLALFGNLSKQDIASHPTCPAGIVTERPAFFSYFRGKKVFWNNQQIIYA